MITTIIKRDGREAPFNQKKIADAIYKAAQVTGGRDYSVAEELAAKVTDYIENELKITAPTVEKVQDVVEKVLSDSGYSRTSKEYILYRAERTRVREMNTRLMKTYEDLTFKPSHLNDIKRGKRQYRRRHCNGNNAEIWLRGRKAV